jgi:hypothetical protein
MMINWIISSSKKSQQTDSGNTEKRRSRNSD